MKGHQNRIGHDKDEKLNPPDSKQNERAVVDTKQPSPTNQPVRKTDPSSHSFEEEE